jgi:hypothetical protein
MQTREDIYEALFKLTYGIAGVRTQSRKLKVYSDVPPAECPAIFQNQTGEHTFQLIGQPKIVTLKCDWYLYLNTNGARNIPQSVQLNNFLTQIDSMFTPDIMTGTFTLGGIVSHCWIEGETKIVEGVLGDYSIVIIPINIKTSEVI